MYKVNEIFHSLQGEGYNTGTASVFIRLSGCNLRCTFCDTRHNHGTIMSLPQIVDEVMKYPQAPLIVITGGEPTLQVDEALIQALHLTRKRIAIETNGTRPVPAGIDWLTLSPKQGFEGGDSQPCILTQCDELKVVYLGQDLAQYNHITATHRYLQPCYSDDDQARQQSIKDTVKAVLTHPEWRLSLQTHRILNIP
ncbi:MAG: 7-carboxy-7-deazaguanine synthase QueE [Muribaculaceae bacterium]|nr:7-carboxy-7-deazaguanine synthase QueE [Muribaculaceae bacterium]